MHGRSVPPWERMTIRCIALITALPRGVTTENRAPADVFIAGFAGCSETLRDVAIKKQMKFVDVETLYGIDSPANFIRFATDHYGELGLSRLNIFASNKR